jgi:hypothetical protein
MVSRCVRMALLTALFSSLIPNILFASACCADGDEILSEEGNWPIRIGEEAQGILQGHLALHTGERDPDFEFEKLAVIGRVENNTLILVLSREERNVKTLKFQPNGNQAILNRGLRLIQANISPKQTDDPYSIYKEHRYDGALTDLGGTEKRFVFGPEAILYLHGIGNACPSPEDFRQWTLITQISYEGATEPARGTGQIGDSSAVDNTNCFSDTQQGIPADTSHTSARAGPPPKN